MSNQSWDLDELPLVILESPPEAIAIMLDEIRAELGEDQVAFLREAKALGRVMAVLLEFKVAGRKTNLLEAAVLAGVEDRVAPLFRATDLMEFSPADLDGVIEHMLPALSEFEAAAIRREAA